jgi:FkbM family methyltransferase
MVFSCIKEHKKENKMNFGRLLKRIAIFLWFRRSRFCLFNIPLPCRLPYGGWYLAYGDEMGFGILRNYLLGINHEESEWRFIAAFLKPGMTFFDLGANQGFYSILASKCVGTEGQVYAFEPVPGEFRHLRQNVLLNRLKNTIREPLALGRQEGSTDMYVCLDGKGSYSSLQPPEENLKVRRELIRVPIIDLDSYVQHNNIRHIDFLKIDVEGGELDVLKGAVMVLKELRPVVMCEIADVRTQPWGYNASEIYKFLEKCGYQWFQIVPGGRLLPSKVKEKYDPDWENLVGVPNGKLGEISNFREDT